MDCTGLRLIAAAHVGGRESAVLMHCIVIEVANCPVTFAERDERFRRRRLSPGRFVAP